MSKMTASLVSKTSPQEGPTLEHVLPLITGFTEVSAQARQNMTSALRALCRTLDRPPSSVPIAAPLFRQMVSQAHPAAFGLSVSRWSNIKSDVRRAIRMSGLSTKAAVSEVPLTAAWNALLSLPMDPWSRSSIRGFGRFCSSQQTEPQDLDEDILQRFHDHLEAHQLARVPIRSVQVVARAWNNNIATSADGSYARLTAPNRSRKYALDWQDLPASLRTDVEAFHKSSLEPDPLAAQSRRPIKPSTVKNRDFMIRQLAAAQVTRGIDKNELKSLADLFQIDRLKEGLRFFLARNNGHPNDQVRHLINLALVVGKRWSQLPKDKIEELSQLAPECRRSQNGLTEKNRTKLRQFADERVIVRFLGLPKRMFKRANKAPLTNRSALLVQTALAIEILTFAPIRVGNLVMLDRHKHFHWARCDGKRLLHMVIPAADVKNDIHLEFPLSQEVTAMLDTYMETFQPLLTRGKPSGYLFPGMKGGPKNQAGFSRAITATLDREMGLKMNPHLFRHFAAMLFLEYHPGSYEEVRRILGHKRITTTLQNYAGLETAAAVRRYDEVVLSHRNATPLQKGKKS